MSNKEQKIAKLQTKAKTIYPQSGLTVAIINLRLGLDGDIIYFDTLNFYSFPKKAAEDYQNMATVAIENKFIIAGVVVIPCLSKRSDLLNHFMTFNARLGIKANNRIAYRRPWAFVSYLGSFEELRGDRHELLKMKVQIRNDVLTVAYKQVFNMCGNGVTTCTMPVFQLWKRLRHFMTSKTIELLFLHTKSRYHK